MSERFDDAQTLTRYLLGSLPAAEAERLDELSVIDDELAEALSSVENDLIDAYVHGELGEAARAQFTTHYLASASRRERVAFAQAFKAYAERGLTLRAATARPEAANEARAEEAAAATEAEAVPRRKGRNIFSALRDFKLSRPAWAWGAASAALALVVVGGWLIFENARRQQPAQADARINAPEQQAPKTQKESADKDANGARPADERAREGLEPSAQEPTQNDRQRLAEQQRAAEGQRVEQRRAAEQKSPASRAGGGVASFILAPQLRGASQSQSISIPTDAERVALRLRLEPDESETYRVALLDETGARALWRGGRVKARSSADGKTLGLNIRARLLKPQANYLLRVTNDAGEIVDDYPFRVVK
jgi:hypothetical protein